MKPGKAANIDPKIRLMRRAATEAIETRGIGGREKTRNRPKKITLPKLKCLEGDNTK